MLEGRVLVTGGTGTLGHALVRLARQEDWPCEFTIYSRSELLQAQMRQCYPGLRFVLGDVRDYDRLAAAVAGHDMVVHAAAQKRIPECEAHPTECYATNVVGSANVVRACLVGGVKRCIGISTDKAVRAITIYGASKLMMEGLFRAAEGDTIFTLVRYGNVLASRGSVIPIWREQASKGLPLTITERSMTRFWLRPRHAAQLVADAADLPAGCILVPRLKSLTMGEMAEVVCPGADLVEIGLRSTEKRHEDLVHPDEPALYVEPVDGAYGCYIVHAPGGTLGHVFTSQNAARMTPGEFAAMLHDVEAWERGL